MKIAARLAIGIFAATVAGTSPAPAQLQEVTIGLGSGSLTGGTARIAKELGLFERHGLDAKLIVMDSGSASAAALASRSLKFAGCGPGDLLTLKARGQDVIAVAPIYSGLGVNLILAKTAAEKLKVSPTAAVSDRLKALDGILIGTTSPTTVATITLKRAAEAVGANVRFTYLAQPAFLAALETGAIQGHIGGAPFWARPIVNGSGIQWINGAKGEFPAAFAPSMSALLATRRDVAESEPELVRKVAAALVDLGKAVQERPGDVKAAIAKLYPDLDAATIALLFDSEAGSWISRPITAQQLAHEIAYLKSTGTAPPELDRVDPASMIFR